MSAQINTGFEYMNTIDASLPSLRWGQALSSFLYKQISAAAFGILLLIAILLTRAIWQESWAIARYDALLAFAISVQILFLVFKLESLAEARVILLFHATGTLMEWFKVAQSSWSYPEPAVFAIWGVPLFSGFMYASVGSYIARSIRLFEMRFAPYPPLWVGFVLGGLIYANFFSHHYIADLRIALFAATMLLFWRTQVWFRLRHWHKVPMPLAALFASFALWVAESVGTYTGTWIYYGQASGQLASFAKMGSWYLLLWVSFMTVTLVMRSALIHQPWSPDPKVANAPNSRQ